MAMMESSFDDLIDRIDEHKLRISLERKRRSIEENGTKEPTDYSPEKLVQFYIQITEEINKFAEYSLRYPNQQRTMAVKKEVITENLCDILDFQTAWNVLKTKDSHLSIEQFKSMDPSKRQEEFLQSLEEGVKGFSDVYRKRSYAVELGIKEGILPEHYE